MREAKRKKIEGRADGETSERDIHRANTTKNARECVSTIKGKRARKKGTYKEVKKDVFRDIILQRALRTRLRHLRCASEADKEISRGRGQ